jgi:NAD-dependent DNA ligase
MNASMVPSDILASTAPRRARRVSTRSASCSACWSRATRARIRPAEVRSLSCTDKKEIIYRCIGERRKRYGRRRNDHGASTSGALNAGVTRSLDGVHLAFTGILSRPRNEAKLAAKRAGAIVHSGPSVQTTVLVRGRPNPLEAAGRDGGVKLLEFKRLREKGHNIRILGDAAFWRLVETPGSGRRAQDVRRRRE